MHSPLTPSQTVGPFHHIELPLATGGQMVAPETSGAIRITGQVLDGAGAPVDDALLEIWQAAPSGRYAHPADERDLALLEGFTGFGRVATGDGGAYEVWTVKPGPVPGPGGSTQAPHLLLTVMARGLLDRVVTRMYFPDEAAANGADPILALVPVERRGTLVAEAGEGASYRFDIRLQGDRETVFFDI